MNPDNTSPGWFYDSAPVRTWYSPPVPWGSGPGHAADYYVQTVRNNTTGSYYYFPYSAQKLAIGTPTTGGVATQPSCVWCDASTTGSPTSGPYAAQGNTLDVFKTTWPRDFPTVWPNPWRG